MKIDLTKMPEIIETLNEELSADNIVELKAEKNGKRIVVVRINRRVKAAADND